MKGILVRVCSWFSMIVYSLLLIVVFIIEDDPSSIIVFFMCLCISVTGWFGRKFGLPEFKNNKFSKLSAIFSLIFGIAFMVVFPIIFGNLFGFKDSFLAIRNLIILFLPVVITSVAILSSKSGEKEGQIDKNPKAPN